MSAIATIGTFDGFHAGHAHLVDRLIAEGRQRGLTTLAVTFDRHPLAVVAPERTPRLLSSRSEVAARLTDAGVDRVEVMIFDRDAAAMTACDFMRRLREEFGVTALLVGYDNTFGSDRPATAEAYAAAASEAGVKMIFDDRYIDPLTGETPSSSLLRRLLSQGDVADFARLAGRQYTLAGTVARGLRNGHRLGFPTLNLAFDPALAVPATGVYAGAVIIGAAEHPAVINVGHNPTIASGNPLTVEAHVPDTDLGDLYGSEVSVTFRRRLRDEHRFASLDELRSAISNDIQQLNT